MRAPEGFGLISLLAVVCTVWALVGLLETRATALREGSAEFWQPLEAGLPTLPPIAGLPRLARKHADVLAAAITMSVFPEPDLEAFRPTEPLGEGANSPILSVPRGWARARSFSRPRPVAEAPTWLILSLAGGSLLARSRAARS